MSAPPLIRLRARAAQGVFLHTLYEACTAVGGRLMAYEADAGCAPLHYRHAWLRMFQPLNLGDMARAGADMDLADAAPRLL